MNNLSVFEYLIGIPMPTEEPENLEIYNQENTVEDYDLLGLLAQDLLRFN